MPANKSNTDAIGAKAAELIQPGMVVGLGTGSAATSFIKALGAKVQAGLTIRGLPTSEVSAKLATELGIPLVTFDDVPHLDVCVDGADEIDPNGDLIKGYGGALVREKIVAAYAKKFVILAGFEKRVKVLGERGKLPVEVLTFALTPCRRALETMGFPSELRKKDGEVFVTDNGNYILDCHTTAIDNPAETDTKMLAIPGVVGTGLFAKMAHVVMIQNEDGSIEVRAT